MLQTVQNMDWNLQVFFCKMVDFTINETVDRSFRCGVSTTHLELHVMAGASPRYPYWSNFQVHAYLSLGEGYPQYYSDWIYMNTAFAYWMERGLQKWERFLAEQMAVYQTQHPSINYWSWLN